ncbi:cation diffusion facilitator family transporter [Planctomycetota bacterium]|nr:cation diffusion facilitator family transporter [Planctomycetota bacterium]
MPDPQPNPNQVDTLKVAIYALSFGILITLFKFCVYIFTGSVAILADTLESIINIVAAAVMLYTIWYSNRPADKTHPYGHGKIEFLAVGFEGALILFAGIIIVFKAIPKLFTPTLELDRLSIGMGLLFVIGLLTTGLALYVTTMGKRTNNQVIKADGKHLFTDALSTLGVFLGLILVNITGWTRLDPIIALIIAGIIFPMSWRLLWQSLSGLMDRSDPADQKLIENILNLEVENKTIISYHKVRHRHTGSFHWVDMHLQVNPELSVAQSHDLASSIENKIELALGSADATAHVEPPDAYCEHNPETAHKKPSTPTSSTGTAIPAHKPHPSHKEDDKPFDPTEPIDLAPPREDIPTDTTESAEQSTPSAESPSSDSEKVFTKENALTGSGDLYDLAHEEASPPSPPQEEQDQSDDSLEDESEEDYPEESDDDFNAPNPNA